MGAETFSQLVGMTSWQNGDCNNIMSQCLAGRNIIEMLLFVTSHQLSLCGMNLLTFYGHISISGLKSDVTIMFLDPDFL